MCRFCIVLSSVMFVFGSGAATAQNYLHCYIGDAPADALASTDRNLTGFLTSIQIASLRHGCSLDTGEDKAMLDRRLTALLDGHHLPLDPDAQPARRGRGVGIHRLGRE